MQWNMPDVDKSGSGEKDIKNILVHISEMNSRLRSLCTGFEEGLAAAKDAAAELKAVQEERMKAIEERLTALEGGE